MHLIEQYNYQSLLDLFNSELEVAKKTYIAEKKRYSKANIIAKTFPEEILNAAFLDRCISVLGYLPLVPIKRGDETFISPTKIIEKLNGSPDATVDTPDGEVRYSTLWTIIKLLYKIPRSNFIPNQTENPRLGWMTPLVMYAVRLHNPKAKYSMWDREDENLCGFLGSGLESIREFGLVQPFSSTNHAELSYMREEQQTVNRYGKISTEAINKKGKGYLGTKSYDLGEDEDKNILEYPRTALIMMLQTWLAYGGLRDTSAMILDPIHWDRIPGELDAMSEPREKGVKKEQKSYF